MNIKISNFVDRLISELDIDSACIWNKNCILSLSLKFKNKLKIQFFHELTKK